MFKAISFLGVLGVVAIVHITGAKAAELRLIQRWRELEYAFPSKALKDDAMRSGKYVPGNGVPIDVEVDYTGKKSRKTGKQHAKKRTGRLPSSVLVTVPRFTTGIPITLGTVTNMKGNYGPLIQGYPDYSWHSSHGKDCDGMTSVFRVQIDECNRLWVLDTGRIDETQHCQPQLLVFNLQSDTLIHRYRIPEGQFQTGNSLLVTPIVDVRDPDGKCRDTYVYMADVNGNALVVYSTKHAASWRVNNKLFYPDPKFGTFTVAGETFDLMDGVLGMSLSARGHGTSARHNAAGLGSYSTVANSVYPADRTLFFHSLASNSENAVSTAVLDNATAWQHSAVNPRDFKEIGVRRSQSAAEAVDRNGIMFFGLMDPISIACWDTSTKYNADNIHIVALNNETLQFASGVKVVTNARGVQELWVMTSSFQKVMTGSLSNQDVNFRILALQVAGLLKNGRCAPSDSSTADPKPNYSPLVFPNQ